MDKSWVIWKISSTIVRFDPKTNIRLKLGSWMERYLWVPLLIWCVVWDSIQLRNKYKTCRMKSGIANILITIRKLWVSFNFKLFCSYLLTTDLSMESPRIILTLLYRSLATPKKEDHLQWVVINWWSAWPLKVKKWQPRSWRNARRSCLGKVLNYLKK